MAIPKASVGHDMDGNGLVRAKVSTLYIIYTFEIFTEVAFTALFVGLDQTIVIGSISQWPVGVH